MCFIYRYAPAVFHTSVGMTSWWNVYPPVIPTERSAGVYPSTSRPCHTDGAKRRSVSINLPLRHTDGAKRRSVSDIRL